MPFEYPVEKSLISRFYIADWQNKCQKTKDLILLLD
nr:MAG TPA: hypothetical protein [Caudoviricetes sp.]